MDKRSAPGNLGTWLASVFIGYSESTGLSIQARFFHIRTALHFSCLDKIPSMKNNGQF